MIAPPQKEFPTPRKAAAQFTIHDDERQSLTTNLCNDSQLSLGMKRTSSNANSDKLLPLTTSKLGNQQQNSTSKSSVSSKKLDDSSSSSPEDTVSHIDRVLSFLDSATEEEDDNDEEIQRPNADFGEQIFKASKHTELKNNPGDLSKLPAKKHISDIEKPNTSTSLVNISEFNRLKKELEAAHEKLAFIGQQSIQLPVNEPFVRNVAPFALSETGVGLQSNKTLPPSYNLTTSQTQPKYLEVWSSTEDATSDRSAKFSPAPFEPYQRSWSGTSNNSGHFGQSTFTGNSPWNQNNSTPLASRYINSVNSHGGQIPAPEPRRASNFRLDSLERPMPHNINISSFDQNLRSVELPPTRPNSAFQGNYMWNSYPASVASSTNFSPPMTPLSFQPMGLNQPSYQPRPIGTPLSPTAIEFSAPWNPQPAENGTTYVPTVEPMNYRRLLDRNMSCNWKYIVDKIVCNNDQQASIFLQQKLKVATPEQKFEMVEAIITQAYPLMINRFGNFLIQRCFEHGTPEQVVAIANTIRGNTLALSMDAFGCHVVQKAFDVVPEDYKAIMVHELLRRIPETVIHRYACHVWQKLFELRWSDSPPQIMKYVNEALRGMWHEVALGETGSLVVQNIFENCLEEDKRPCINEVLANIDIISHGQFGNWCIQHICEHGAPADRSRATEHVLRFSTEYSMDQFASKVIEKCLKVGAAEFLERYLDKVCEARPDRPRMPLIDIAGDQYGNYLVQWILINAAPQHREVVANHVRKHMVSLRGSKFGSRVAMLCCNSSFVTRPGPPAGMAVNRYMPNNNMARHNFSQYR